MNEKLSEMQQLLYELKQAQMNLQKKMAPTDWVDEANLRSVNSSLKSALTILKEAYPETIVS